MGFIKKVKHLKRYKDLAWLLVKYGQSDLVAHLELIEEGVSIEVEAESSEAEDFARDLEKLGPTYIKLGQFFSTRADFLPPAYLEALGRLQDNVEPLPFEQIKETITEELGIRLFNAFETFDETPMAAASIGQVHLATLRDGRAVAVKVQRPGIRKQIIDDLDALEGIAEFLEKNTDIGRQLMLHATLIEFRKTMFQELNFTEEASNLVSLGNNLNAFERIIVPSPINNYFTTHVLTMEYVKGRNIDTISKLTLLELDGESLVEELYEAYLQQILIDGFYHADPHPGNIFLTDDGRIALIDLGMVARLPENMQEGFTRLLIAISENNGEKAADHILKMGERLDEIDEVAFRRDILEMVDRFDGNLLKQLKVGHLILELTKVAATSGIRLPNEMIMLAKTLMNLDRVGQALNPSFNPNAFIRERATALIQGRMQKDASPGKLFEALLDTKEFVEELPGRVNSILNALASNEFTINTNAIDQEAFMADMKEISNRVSLSIVLAALIVGAALLMRVETSFTLLGYPGIAIVFFLLAGIGGLILAGKILCESK